MGEEMRVLLIRDQSHDVGNNIIVISFGVELITFRNLIIC